MHTHDVDSVSDEYRAIWIYSLEKLEKFWWGEKNKGDLLWLLPNGELPNATVLVTDKVLQGRDWSNKALILNDRRNQEGSMLKINKYIHK